jgi:hypothetical protein
MTKENTAEQNVDTATTTEVKETSQPYARVGNHEFADKQAYSEYLTKRRIESKQESKSEPINVEEISNKIKSELAQEFATQNKLQTEKGKLNVREDRKDIFDTVVNQKIKSGVEIADAIKQTAEQYPEFINDPTETSFAESNSNWDNIIQQTAPDKAEELSKHISRQKDALVYTVGRKATADDIFNLNNK